MNFDTSNKKYSILIAEDVAVQAKKLQYVLNKYGYDVNWAENGKKGIEMLRQKEYQLIISDYQMPEMDGLEFLEAIKKDEDLKKIPFILLTTIEDEAILLKSLGLGANEFLNKPFRPEELKIRCKNLVMLYEYQKLMESENANLSNELLEKNRILEESFSELKRTHEQLKEMQQQIIMTSKMASLGTMGAGIAHEINNPLTIISTYNENLKKLLDKQEIDFDRLAKITQTIDRGVGRITKIVRHLKVFSATESYDKNEAAPLDLNEIIRDLNDFIGGLITKYEIVAKFELAETPLMIRGIRTIVEQIFLNIIHNAVDAMEGCPKRELTLKTVLDGEKVVATIVDSGPGIPPEVQQKIFDPFFTTKGPNRGTGLGMTLVLSYVKECDGEISFKTSTEGTTFFLKFPYVKKEG